MMDEGRASGEKHVKLSVYSVPHLARPSFKEATSKTFKPTKIGESFGPSWSTHWFRIQLSVPPELHDKKHLEFHWDADNEGLVWSENGEPLQGLTGGGERIEWILPRGWTDGKEHIFYVEMACNAMFGNAPGGDSIQPPKPDKYFQLQTADIVAVNLEARALFVDFWIIGGDHWLPVWVTQRILTSPRCRERIPSGFVGGTQSSPGWERDCGHLCSGKPKINRCMSKDCSRVSG